MKRQNLIWIGSVLILATLSRLLPHPDNFTAVGAMALFGGAVLGKRSYGLLLPLLALVFGDLLIIGRSPAYADYIFGPGFLPVYGSFLLYYLIGAVVANSRKPLAVGAGSLIGSVVFFLITNFFTWKGGTMYDHTTAGLMTAYTAGIPFFWNTLAGDLFFSLVLFGSYALAQRFVPAFQKAQ